MTGDGGSDLGAAHIAADLGNEVARAGQVAGISALVPMQTCGHHPDHEQPWSC
jgi:hypothetical protein